ncbi:type II toxin-antitoxin system toxin ribonuclease VapC11 [soil metagenome]
MILVDTSAWIEFQRAAGSASDRRLTQAVERDEELATTGIVLMELLAGARNDAHASDLRRLLGRCAYLRVEEPTDHELAADAYRACRRAGETVRRLPDCLIAAVAMRTGSPVLHCDADFKTLARHTALQLVS